MEWLKENWFFIAVAVLFFWMHTKMHSGHGSHGGRGGGGCGGGHRHGAEDDRPHGTREDPHARH